jgi:hypothetical protein
MHRCRSEHECEKYLFHQISSIFFDRWPWAYTGQPYYRRRAKARQEAALAVELNILSRAEAFTRQLQAKLAEAARCQAIAAGIIGEMAIFGRAAALNA